MNGNKEQEITYFLFYLGRFKNF